jgi:hypothetical protein
MGNFKALIGILSQIVRPSPAIWANSVQSLLCFASVRLKLTRRRRCSGLSNYVVHREKVAAGGAWVSSIKGFDHGLFNGEDVNDAGRQ